MERGTKSEHAQTITFRIDSHVYEKLKKHANFERVTLNTTVNQLLSHAVNWDVVAAKAGWVPVEGPVLKSILDSLDEDEIIRIAKMAGDSIARDMSLSMMGSFTVSNWVNILNLRSTSAGFGFSQIDDGESIKFIMKHDMGTKFSLHWKAFYEYGFKRLGCPVTLEYTENTVVYRIPRKQLKDSTTN